MAYAATQITKMEQTVTDEDGDFTLTMWVMADETGDDPVVISGEYAIDATPPAGYVSDLLVAGGYNPL